MTLLEFFEDAPIENMISCLYLKPERVIFLGNQQEIGAEVKRYREYIEKYKPTPIIDSVNVDKNNISDCILEIEKIVDKYGDCVFDLTGGEEHLIAAATVVYERKKHLGKIKMHSMNIKDRLPIDSDGDGNLLRGNSVALSVDDWITLHGGKAVFDSKNSLSATRSSEIDGIWRLMCHNAKDWNKMLQTLHLFEKRVDLPNKTALNIAVNLGKARTEIRDYTQNHLEFKSVMTKFEDAGLIDVSGEAGGYFYYKYPNLLIKNLLSKAGDLLEVKTLVEAQEFLESGKPFFNDCKIGVTIDWDGIIHNNERYKDTKNEIDIILMHCTTPVFISCKNGDVDENELYKLSTVSERFGGEYVGKMLVITHFECKDPNEKEALKTRARDMGIHLITDACHFKKSDWQSAFRKVADL